MRGLKIALDRYYYACVWTEIIIFEKRMFVSDQYWLTPTLAFFGA